MSICYRQEKSREQYKTKPLNKIAQTWNDEFELPDGSSSVSYIEDYIGYIIKKQEKLPTNSPIHIFINRIINRLIMDRSYIYEHLK